MRSVTGILFASEARSQEPEFGYSRQRYFPLRTLFHEHGAAGLVSRKRGPKTHCRRTGEIVSQVVRYRFLEPEISSEVIAQKLRQADLSISARSVDRILAEFGLQKKLYEYRPGRPPLRIGDGSFKTAGGDLGGTWDGQENAKQKCQTSSHGAAHGVLGVH